jgi:predicted nucleic acid-binding protein
MIVADASWFIALRDPDDPHHRSAVRVNDASIDEIIVLHPVTFAECLVGPARLDRLDDAARAARAAFQIADIDADAPLRWAKLRATTTLRLPDVIVLDTALVHAASAILTFDRQLAAEATGRSIASPATHDAHASE